jgi:hypothetical protein
MACCPGNSRRWRCPAWSTPCSATPARRSTCCRTAAVSAASLDHCLSPRSPPRYSPLLSFARHLARVRPPATLATGAGAAWLAPERHPVPSAPDSTCPSPRGRARRWVPRGKGDATCSGLPVGVRRHPCSWRSRSVARSPKVGRQGRAPRRAPLAAVGVGAASGPAPPQPVPVARASDKPPIPTRKPAHAVANSGGDDDGLATGEPTRSSDW